MEELASKGKEACGKISRVHGGLDHEAEVQISREVELERLRGESREKETLLTQLSEAQESWRGGAHELKKED